MNVYIVIADYQKDGAEITEVFSESASAQSFAKSCNKHTTKRPFRLNSKGDFKEYMNKLDSWKEKHPAVKFYLLYNFRVIEKEVTHETLSIEASRKHPGAAI